MKRFVAAGICILFLSACGMNAEETASKAEDTDTHEEDEKEESTETQPTKDTGNAEAEKEKKQKEDEKEDQEESDDEMEPLYKVSPEDSSIQPLKDGVDEQKVLITIDDAPDTYSVEMAEKLNEMDVPAIFFVNGHFLKNEEGREKLKTISDMGFEIGNHTMTHSRVSKLSKEELETEIGDLNKMIKDITGETPDFFRAPNGINSEESKAYLKEHNMIWMNWSYGYDWEAEYQDAKALTDIMLHTELLRDGANLLMHDREWTNKALPDIIEGYQEKGYGFIDPDRIQRK